MEKLAYTANPLLEDMFVEYMPQKGVQSLPVRTFFQISGSCFAIGFIGLCLCSGGLISGTRQLDVLHLLLTDLVVDVLVLRSLPFQEVLDIRGYLNSLLLLLVVLSLLLGLLLGSLHSLLLLSLSLIGITALLLYLVELAFVKSYPCHIICDK